MNDYLGFPPGHTGLADETVPGVRKLLSMHTEQVDPP